MSAPGLRERKKERTRQAIELAAYDLVLRHGWAGTTVTAIADAAEVSPRTVAVYYPNKIDIMFGEHAAGPARLDILLDDVTVSIPEAVEAWLAERSAKVDPDVARVRMRAIESDAELRLRDRGLRSEWEQVVAEAAARRTGQRANDIGPRMIGACAATLVSTFREYLERTEPPFAQTSVRAFELLEHLCTDVARQA